jgi:hypothetical protein
MGNTHRTALSANIGKEIHASLAKGFELTFVTQSSSFHLRTRTARDLHVVKQANVPWLAPTIHQLRRKSRFCPAFSAIFATALRGDRHALRHYLRRYLRTALCLDSPNFLLLEATERSLDLWNFGQFFLAN